MYVFEYHDIIAKLSESDKGGSFLNGYEILVDAEEKG
jgi:hypothetical protein